MYLIDTSTGTWIDQSICTWKGTLIGSVMSVMFRNHIFAYHSLGLSFLFFRPNLPQLGLFNPYFVCKCCFREISIKKFVFLDQNKKIWLILKNK